MMKIIVKIVFLVLALLAGEAAAVATCTSKATGNWGASSTWDCVGTPAVTVPESTNPVVLASPYTVTLNNDYTATSLTINSGATLSDTNGRVLIVTGNIANNGMFTSNNSGVIASTGAAAVISGSGTFANQARLYTSGLVPTIAADSTLSFTGTAQIRTGRDPNDNTVASSVLTINGTLNGSGLTSGSTFIRLYASSTVVSSTGIINAGTAIIEYRATGTLTNNGSVTIGTIRRNSGKGIWTNAANSNLTVNTSFSTSSLTLNASATGNTVTYNSPSTPITPSSNTYFNLAGTGVVCPVSYIILGTSPCATSLYVQGSPTSCTNVTGVGTIAWANPTNAYTSNNVYATASNVIKNTTTNYLNCTGFNLAAPASATINGITLYVERKTSGGTIKDAYVYLIKGGTLSTALNGATSTSYPTTDAIEAHGGQTNLWGTTWTVADVNAANFGVAFSAKNTSTTSTTNRTISVDHIQIRADYTTGAAAPDHIEIDYPAPPLSTCATTPVTVYACGNAACTSYYTGGVSVTLSPGGNVVTIPSGSSSGSAMVFQTATGAATLDAVSVPAELSASTCKNVASGAFNCSVNFSSAALTMTVPNMAAGNTVTGSLSACTAQLPTGPNTVNFYTTYQNPGTGTKQAVINGTALATSAPGTAISVTSNGASPAAIATFSLSYPDVGQVGLTASKAGASGSGTFIARPAWFVLSGIKQTAAPQLANPAAADASGAKFVKAGEAFTATVTAVNSAAAATPNYGKETTSESVKLTPVLVAALGQINNPTIGGTFGSFTNGIATGTAFTWNEVGIITITPRVLDADYLGAGDTTGTVTGNVGRFYPHHFDVAPDATIPVENRSDLCEGGFLVVDGVTACTSPAFTYMDEQMNAQFTLTAMSASGAITSNYTTSAIAGQNFAKLDLTTASSNTLGFGAVNDPTGTPDYLSSRMDASLSPGGSFNAGAADIVAPIVFARSASPDGPYTSLNISVAPKDSDGVTADVTLFDLGTTAVAVPDHVKIGLTEARYGRINISNALGSELLDLPMSMTAEYWNGSGWIKNINDQHTAGIILTKAVATDPIATLCAWDTGVGSGSSGLGCTVAGTSINKFYQPPSATDGGNFNLNFQAPGIGNTGAMDITATVPAYLKFNWKGAGDTDPSARATFGIYKGNSKFIYTRELY